MNLEQIIARQEEKLTEIVYRNWKNGDEVGLYEEVKNLNRSSIKEILEGVVSFEKEKLKDSKNKCAKCFTILDNRWLPPICQSCFYSDDKDKWNGVKTKEATDQRTLGHNEAKSDTINYLVEIIKKL